MATDKPFRIRAHPRNPWFKSLPESFSAGSQAAWGRVPERVLSESVLPGDYGKNFNRRDQEEDYGNGDADAADELRGAGGL